MDNPFPERGVARSNSYYNPYWLKKQKDVFTSFLNGLSPGSGSLLFVNGALGSGKTATLFFIKKKIEETYPTNSIVLYWQLTDPPKGLTFTQTFFKGFLMELQTELKNRKLQNLIKISNYSPKFDFINALEHKDHKNLMELIHTLRDFLLTLPPVPKEIIEEQEIQTQKIQQFIFGLTGKNYDKQDIQDMVKNLLDPWGYIIDNIPKDEHEIKVKMKEILELLQKKITNLTIVILLDEFDIVIRNLRENITEGVLKQLRDFLLWLNPEELKGYHLVASLFSENLDRLIIQQDGTRIDSIYRRTINRIFLYPLESFDDFYNNIYLKYLEIAENNQNYEFFDKDFLRFIFFSAKKNLGSIFGILHNQYVLWKDKIDREEKIELFDLVWDENSGIHQYFYKNFTDLCQTKNRKLIFIYLMRNKNDNAGAPTYEKLQKDVGLSNPREVREFHEQLRDNILLAEVFPYFQDHFFIDIAYSFRLFNFISMNKGSIDAPPPTGVEMESINFIAFMKKFTLKQSWSQDIRSRPVRSINDGFCYMLEDLFELNQNPLSNYFQAGENVLVRKFDLQLLITNMISDEVILQAIKALVEKFKMTFFPEFELKSFLIQIVKEKQIIQQFLILFLPIFEEDTIKFDENLNKILCKFIDVLKIDDHNLDAIILFNNFIQDSEQFEFLFTQTDEDKPWVHTINKIIPIYVQTEFPIPKNTVHRQAPFNVICTAFYLMHTLSPNQENRTYFDMLFSAGNDYSDSNKRCLQEFLQYIFSKYNLFQTLTHDSIDRASKKFEGEQIPRVSIAYFPKFIFDLFTFMSVDFPLTDDGVIIRQKLELPFKIGNHVKKFLIETLNKILDTSSLKLAFSERDSNMLAVLKNLEVLNFLQSTLTNEGMNFSVRTDQDSLFHFLENIVSEKTEEDVPFDVDILSLKSCTKQNFTIIEQLLDFLVKNRKIFEHYEELEEKEEKKEETEEERNTN